MRKSWTHSVQTPKIRRSRVPLLRHHHLVDVDSYTPTVFNTMATLLATALFMILFLKTTALAAVVAFITAP